MLLVILMEKKFLEFYKKELQKTNQNEFRVEKVVKRKAINYMLDGKVMIILLTDGLIKKTV